MARSRNIKPGFFTNDELGEMKPLTRLLFIGLWTIADREGRLKDRPKKIKAECLPYDQINVDSCLGELSEAGFIARYQVDGENFIQIQNWHKHQSPHHKENQSEIPEFKEEIHACVKHGSSMTDKHETGTNPAALIVDSGLLIPDSGFCSSGDEPRKEKFDQKSGFEEAWKAYPRKEGRTDAERHYRTSVKTAEAHRACMSSIENYKKAVEADNEKRKDGNKRDWKLGSTFFNKWQDYKEPVNIEESEDRWDRVRREALANGGH